MSCPQRSEKTVDVKMPLCLSTMLCRRRDMEWKLHFIPKVRREDNIEKYHSGECGLHVFYSGYRSVAFLVNSVTKFLVP